ncbi:Putative ABC transport system membrane protein [Alloactinosynnema sp. L-07]|uniref:ABC transporter permease n=1 Tax=Alloactinosynnema sp. L-07 TaxID=1653480 RepID=UPI00065F0B62|nr:ABC transporter permease [Alloactinosynnema sp. L-07]CRK60623.1 Putative ABC transport system membrane protein [Alloactinosynnema sp. L-07]
MTLLAVERIKLFTTRSPWWSTLAALAVTVGFAALMAGTAETEIPMTVAASQFGYSFGLVVVMVMAALAVTTEYRFSTIRATFQAIPNRTAALLAKTVVVALLAAVIGELAAFGSWGVASLISPADLAINTAFEWRAVAGVGLVYALAGIVSVAVGILIRHSAGAISLLLIYTQLVESLISFIPEVGDDIHKWLPFNLANHFLTGNPDLTGRPQEFGPMITDVTMNPWSALALFAGFSVVMLAGSLAVANRRDA